MMKYLIKRSMLKNKKFFVALLLLGFFLFSLPAQVAESATSTKITLPNPLGKGVTSIPVVAGSILKAALGIMGAVALLMFVYGGFLWLTSGGSADRIKKGKEVMVWAAIGIIIVLSSATLVQFVFDAFKR